MDIHHFVGKKSHTKTCWVYSQKGYDYLAKKLISHIADCMPGMPVPEMFRLSCPQWWTYNGWVEEESVN